MRRRTLAVVLVSLVVLAGCSGTPGGGGETTATGTDTTMAASTETTTGTPTGTATTTATQTRSGYNSFTFKSFEFDPEQIAEEVVTPVGRLDREKRRLATSALERGSATELSLRRADEVTDSPRTLEDGTFLRHEGTYYRVNATVVTNRTGDGYTFGVVGPIPEDSEQYDVADEKAVPFDSLSPTERELFRYGAPPESRRDEGISRRSFDYLPPEDGTLKGSAWLERGSHYVRQGGDLFQVRYAGVRRPTVVRTRIRYALEPVAESARAFVGPRLDEYVVNVTDDVPPEPGRSVIFEAIRSGTYEWEGTVQTRPQSVEVAAQWIRKHSPARSYVYLRYDGAIHRVSVRERIE